MARYILEGKAHTVCDGSYMKEHQVGSAAWIIESNDGDVFVEQSVITSGPGDIQNSYRSKLFGIMGILLYLTNQCKKYNIQTGQIDIHCNGKSAIDRIQYLEQLASNLSQHFDIIQSIFK